MTDKDAIYLLKGLQDALEETNFLERCAIDMAIEALKGKEEKRKQAAKVCKNCKNFRTSGCGAFTLTDEFGSCNFYREAIK